MGVVATLVVGASAPAFGQWRPQPHAKEYDLEIGALAGLLWPPVTHELYSASATHRPFDHFAGLIGGRVSFVAFRRFAIVEADLALMFEQAAGSFAPLVSLQAQVLGQWDFGSSRFAVFGGLGYGFIAVMSGSDVLGADADGIGHFGIGGKYYLSRKWLLRLDVRVGLSGEVSTDSIFNPFPSITFGISRVIPLGKQPLAPVEVPIRQTSGPDRDNDDVPDDEDACKDEPGLRRPNNEGLNGCMDTKDSDGDGRSDRYDTCPYKHAATSTGCPLER